MIDLEIKDSRGNVIIHKLGEGKHTLGKSPSSDIILMDSYASRHHADIIVAGDNIVLIDFNSTNGIWVDNSRVLEKVALKSGSVFRIGRLELMVSESIYNYAIKKGGAYSTEEVDILRNLVEDAVILDLNQHRKLKKKVG